MTSSKCASLAADLLARALAGSISVKFRFGPHGTLQLRIARAGLSKTFSEPLRDKEQVSSQIEELCRQALQFEAFRGPPPINGDVLLGLTKLQK